MAEFNYWKSLFRNNKFPCYVHDKDTDEIIYANGEFHQVFKIQGEVTGRKYHEIIPLGSEKPDWDKHKTYELEFLQTETRKHFRAYATLLRGNQVVFCEIEPLDMEETKSAFELAMTQCLAVFQQPHETRLMFLMEILARYYKAERAYIYSLDQQKSTLACVRQWCKDENLLVTDGEEKTIDVSLSLSWMKEKETTGIVTISTSDESLDEKSKGILSMLQVDNLSFGVLEDSNQTVTGLVGICNYRNSSMDNRLLRTMVRFVSDNLHSEEYNSEAFVLNKDVLTGFYNRVGFNKKAEEISGKPAQNTGVLSVNMNGLKQINLELGNAQGDRYIQQAAERLQTYFEMDFFRMSGDEFIGIASAVAEEEFENKVLALDESMKRDECCHFSLGHAWGKGGSNLSKLIQEAETVMYINKQNYYASSCRSSETINDTILSDLLSYLQNGEFMIYLQPQVKLADASLYGAEALIRRFDKTNQKMVFPDEFIPMYEMKSVIRHVDIFVVEEVCKLLQQWLKIGKAIPISVNLSRVTLREYGIVSSIVEICDRFAVPHHLVVIEVTERVGLIENNVASSLVQEFKDEGFHISLDDFGCAYSNIVTLAQIHVDEVKIDKSLVDNLTTSRSNYILVKNVLTMCNELEGASTLAEGIEDEAQAKMLHQLGCHLGQGYFYSRPIPVNEFAEKYI